MSSDWQNGICQPPLTCSIASIETYFRPITATEDDKSPIDAFYAEMYRIITIGKPEVLDLYPELGSLLLVAGISATENYFREVFSRIIRICPIAQSTSGDKSIPISSIVWHGVKDIERGAFEGQSLACSEYIMKASKNFLKYSIEKDIGTQIFDEFEKLCQLRHNIVHSACVLAGKNAVSLSIPTSDKRIKIVLNFAALQEALSVCSALVIGANKCLFIEMSKRWAVDWVKLPTWSTNKEYERFKNIWTIFYSKTDHDCGRIIAPLTIMKAKNTIKKFYGV